MRVRPLALLLLLGLAPLGCGPADPGAGAPGAADARETPAGTTSSALPAAPNDNVPEDPRPVVVFLGTSLTAGYGLASEDDTYVRRLAELAADEGLPFRARNAGVSGDTSAGGLRRLDWVLRQPLDVLVVELGANDGLRGLPTDALRDNLVAIVRGTRERHPDARIVLVAMEAPPNLGAAYTERFRSVFAEVAEAEGVILAPFLLEGIAGDPSLNQGDGIHPTAEGHERMARNLWPALRRALAAEEAVR